MPTDNMCPQDATTVAFSTVWKPIRPQVTDSDLIGSVIDALVVDENMQSSIHMSSLTYAFHLGVLVVPMTQPVLERQAILTLTNGCSDVHKIMSCIAFLSDLLWL